MSFVSISIRQRLPPTPNSAAVVPFRSQTANSSSSASTTSHGSPILNGSTDHDDTNDMVLFDTGRVLTNYEHDMIQTLITITLPSYHPKTIQTTKFLKNLFSTIFEEQYCKELAITNRLIEIKRITYACVVRQVILYQRRPLPSIEELQTMPFYMDETYIPKEYSEIQSLRHFLRAIQVLYEIGLKGFQNKRTYIEVGGLLDGSDQSYTFGGAPSKATLRRAAIYHVVTGTPLRESNHSAKRRRSDEDDECKK